MVDLSCSRPSTSEFEGVLILPFPWSPPLTPLWKRTSSGAQNSRLEILAELRATNLFSSSKLEMKLGGGITVTPRLIVSPIQNLRDLRYRQSMTQRFP